MKIRSIYYLAFLCLLSSASAAMITTVPGPDDQGGMIMPMVSIVATEGSATNPTAGRIVADLMPHTSPVLRSLQQWSPGSWFAESAAWREALSPVAGSVPGMPAINAGNGDLFNNQYGFMFMGMGMPDSAYVPLGQSLAIRLHSISSPQLQAFNLIGSDNRWDQVFDEVGSQVLWNGTMWHNYFTLPASVPQGVYTVEFEIFIADTAFNSTTGYVQYDEAALSALANPNFESAFVTYEFQVIPEVSTIAVLLAAVCGLSTVLLRRRSRS